MEFDINWLAVLAGTVIHQAIGALWYGVLFRDLWMREMGMTPEEVQTEGPGGEMAVGAVASFLSALSLALLLTVFESPDAVDGIAVGALTGIGFVTAATVMNGVYEQKKPVITVLFGAYYTLGLIAVGAILGAWQ
jgi:hypothetical protein